MRAKINKVGMPSHWQITYYDEETNVRMLNVALDTIATAHMLVALTPTDADQAKTFVTDMAGSLRTTGKAGF